MKSYNHLYEKYLTEENYYQAVKTATQRKSTSHRQRQARYLRVHQEEEKERLMQYAENFKNHKHTPVEIYDGIQRKKRTIIVPSLDEQVIHHMAMNVLKPIFMHGMYEHSYGSIPNRGGHKAKKRIEKWLKDRRNAKYCLKMDIRKYFDSIPHDVLKTKLKDLIHDAKFLNVLYEIIDVQEVGIPLGFILPSG